ncbi:hypothetical protein DPMN_110980 [Dreissena polymorpha]|uniref:Ig-like domain-containing protein n=3 Tax=Dreissena polymorpha TaxID=45954 RepID=A0A9D4QPF9_DREPO|nr:hypothetical protein DPMN_110980 [Dreissena polymorpha]
MHIQVEFAPEVRFKTPRRISQEVGKEALLECFVAAFPHGVSTWTKNGDELIGADESRWKYRTEVYQEDTFTIALYLRILNLEPEDFGTYSCEASNSLGSDKDTILLYEYVKPTPQPSTTRMTPRSPDLAVPRYEQNWHVGRTEINTGERPHAVSGTSHISGFVGASDSIRPSNGAKYLHHTTFSGHMQTTIALAIIKYALYLCSVMS